MKLKSFFIFIAILILSALALFLKTARPMLDESKELNTRLAPVFSKFGLRDENLIRKYIEEKKKGFRNYTHTYREYNIQHFAIEDFEERIRERLDKTRFKLQKSEYLVTDDSESGIFRINFGKFDVLTIKVNKRKAPTFPAVERRYKNPKIAIVMDDFGYNMNLIHELFGINQPVTLSILPNLRYSRDIAGLARSKGYETILHLPLESHREDVREETDTIISGMDDKEIVARLKKDVASVPGLSGVSNHMGSKSTEEKELMAVIFDYLKKNKLYFLDSLTSQQSVCEAVASTSGIRYAKRDIFLDNSDNIDYIKKQLLEMRKIAFKKGSVIAICHDKKNTIKALKRLMPPLAAEGIRFVFLSELVE